MFHGCTLCHHSEKAGILEYVYGIWWRCRQCSSWTSIVPRRVRNVR